VTLEQGVVVKRSQNEVALQREAAALEVLHRSGLPVPRLVDKEKNALYLEYIQGIVYADLVDGISRPQALALGRWLQAHHRLTGGLKGDVNLRNFLWTGTRCVGLDFEDPPFSGELEIDFGRAAAFAVTYRPAFTKRKARCLVMLLSVFLDLGGRADRIRTGYLTELEAMNRRRSKSIAPAQAARFFDHCLERVRR